MQTPNTGRGGGGAANPLSNNRELLRRYIEAVEKQNKMVNGLSFSYPYCGFSTLQSPFAKYAQTMMHASIPRNDTVEESNDDGDAPMKKKPRRTEQATSETEKIKEEVELNDKGVSLMREKGRSSDGLRENDGNSSRFKDFGGIDGVIKELKNEVLWPFRHPEHLRRVGTKPITGILLKGPPGCGKTTLARAIANEIGVPFYEISATELVSGVTGASEKSIRELFSKAETTAPSIVFIDEIDAIASKRDKLHVVLEQRIVTQLMASMNKSRMLVNSVDKNAGSPGYVLVIGATNRPDAIDPALRRPGRFDHEIFLGVPDEYSRAQILSRLTRNARLDGAVDLVKIARSTPGFVGADLDALVDKAGNLAMNRIRGKRGNECSKKHEEEGDCCEECWILPLSDEELENTMITMVDIEEAAKMVQPSSRREGFSTIPNVKWDDVGGLHFLRQEFDRYIVGRIKSPEDYEDFGMDLDVGILLYGPPGCGKTLIAKAVANEAGANFIHVKGPELLHKYVGESELAVRTLFSRARKCSPCILFFDEVDALATKRGKEWVVAERLLKQLMIELDGGDQRKGVYVIGATNSPKDIYHPLLRPGRFGKLMYVPLPSPDERGLILKALARKKPVDASVDLIALGKDNRCDKLSGADLSALMCEAAMAAIDDRRSSSNRSSNVPSTIKEAHFTRALQKISPSVSDCQILHYTLLSESFKAE